MSEYSDSEEFYFPEFYITNKFPNFLKKTLFSSYNDTYDNSNRTTMRVNTMFCKQSLDVKHIYNKFETTISKERMRMEDLFNNVEYNFFVKDIINNAEFVIFSDYEEEDENYNEVFDRGTIKIHAIPPILVKLNQNFKNLYCVIRNTTLHVDCLSCDGATSCSFDISFCSNWYDLFNFCMTEQERNIFDFDENLSENKMIGKICNIPVGEVLSVVKPIPKFNYPTNVMFEFE